MTDSEFIKDENKTVDDKKFNWEDLATGGYSAVNSALFGIPDVLVKAASSDAYQKLKELREKNKGAALVGDIAGAFAPTGGLLAKGIGTTAKLASKGLGAVKLAKAADTAIKVGQAADTASDIIKGTKATKGLSGAIGRGALAAGEAVLPRALSGDADIGEIGLSAGLGAGAGALGYGLSKGLQRLPEKIEDMKKWADKTILKNTDINDKVMRQQRQYMGGDISKYYSDLADLAEAKELHRGPELDKMVAEIKDTWKQLASAFDETNVKLIDNVDAIKSDEAVRNVIARMGNKGDGMLDDLIKKVDATEGFANKREYLNKILFSDKVDDETKALALVAKNILEGAAEELTGLDVGKAKEAWRLMKPFEMADKLDDMRVAGGGLTGGSDTAFKLALGGIGAAAGGGSQIKGVMDDPTNPQVWSKLIAATLGGSAAGFAKDKIGIALARAVRKMPADKIAKMVEDITQGKIAQVLAKIPKEDLPVAASKFFTGQLVDSVDNTKPETTGDIKEEVEKEEIIQQAKEQPEVYMEALNEKMMSYWAENFSDTMEFSEYIAAVKEATNGFDPRNTVNFFFEDKKEREKFITDLEVAGKFKDVDIDEMMKGPGLVEGVLEPGSAAAKKLKKTEFIDTIAKLVTGEGSLPSKTTRDTIQADIASILALDATPDEKKELVLAKLEDKYGLGYSTLKQLGLA